MAEMNNNEIELNGEFEPEGIYISTGELQKLQQYIKRALDERIKAFYDKDFRAGIGGIIANDIIFWYPRFLESLNRKGLSIRFFNSIRRYWSRGVDDIFKNWRQYGIPPLSEEGIKTRLKRYNQGIHGKISGIVSQRTKKGEKKNRKTQMRLNLTPLDFTGRLKQSYKNIRVSGKDFISIERLETKKGDTIRLRIRPPDLSFHFLSQDRQYDSNLTLSQLGIVHYFGSASKRLPSRKMIPVSLIKDEMIYIGGNQWISAEQTDSKNILFNQVLRPAVKDWANELAKLKAKKEKTKQKTTEANTEKLLYDLFKKYFKLPEANLKNFVNLVMSETLEKSSLEIEEFLNKIIDFAKDSFIGKRITFIELVIKILYPRG